ncbi:hypothetical protein [Nonomuraea sediminis]|uniref:hypothetical protein n=1 Tax=Nonomuraea sediminis TaxID=2835864 RepID=UPI001BDD1F74|nr:hypothetical protein [Nonomuraea sediminis]
MAVGAFAIGEEVTSGFNGNWDMIAHVVCADRPAGYAVVEHDASSAGQDDSAAQATCPSGTTVHGTGGLIIPQTAGDTHLYFFSSIEPNMTVVRAHRSTPGQSGTWTLRAQVTCAT